MKYTSKNPLMGSVTGRFVSRACALIATTGAENVLDVGCGEGFILGRLTARRACGVDVSPLAISRAKTLVPDRDYYISNACCLPFKDNSFDLVLAMEVLEHMAEPVRTIEEIERVTGDYCLFSVPNEPWFRMANLLRCKNLRRLGNDREHVQWWSTKSIAGLISTYFDIVRLERPFPWTMLLCRKRAAKGTSGDDVRPQPVQY